MSFARLYISTGTSSFSHAAGRTSGICSTLVISLVYRTRLVLTMKSPSMSGLSRMWLTPTRAFQISTGSYHKTHVDHAIRAAYFQRDQALDV